MGEDLVLDRKVRELHTLLSANRSPSQSPIRHSVKDMHYQAAKRRPPDDFEKDTSPNADKGYGVPNALIWSNVIDCSNWRSAQSGLAAGIGTYHPIYTVRSGTWQTMPRKQQ